MYHLGVTVLPKVVAYLQGLGTVGLLSTGEESEIKEVGQIHPSKIDQDDQRRAESALCGVLQSVAAAL